MIVQSEEQLDEIAGLIVPGMTFKQLGPESRLQVLNLAILAEISHSLDSITVDTARMGEWFKHSKLWEGA